MVNPISGTENRRQTDDPFGNQMAQGRNHGRRDGNTHGGRIAPRGCLFAVIIGDIPALRLRSMGGQLA